MLSRVLDRPMDQEDLPLAKRFKATLFAASRRVYFHQQDPLQFCPKFKYWQKGQFPLDVVFAYTNPGIPVSNITPHFHYIGLSSSGLYCDKRIDEISGNTHSEYRFELTFRLKREPDEYDAPEWPASVMQGFANYSLQLKTAFHPGDFLSFDPPYVEGKYSRIQHALFSEDPQLGTVQTSFGPVKFLQIVGVCEEELKVAEQGKGQSVIELMKSAKGAGGPWLITDMRRDKTVFELDSSVQKAVKPCGTFSHTWLPWLSGSVEKLTTFSKKNK